MASEEVGRHGGAEATGRLAGFAGSFVRGVIDVLAGGPELWEGVAVFAHQSLCAQRGQEHRRY